MMESQKEHILLVESDPQISDAIAQQILPPLGYQVDVIESASLVFKDIYTISPDLIITNLHLPEISGKDLMIALTAQGIDIPVIVITPKGHESDALQAFRLGATNFLTYPIREAEVVSVVEDTITRIRKRNELDNYSHQLDHVNSEIEQVIHDYAEIFSIGKLVPSSASQQSLYDKLIYAAVQITRADSAWLLILELTSGKFILRACSDNEGHLQSMLHLPYEKSLSALVAASSQAVSIHGDSVKRFNLDKVESILVVPIKHEQKVIGMIAVERKIPQPFNSNQKNLLEMIADYATILIDNFSRFQNLEQKLIHLQQMCIYSTIDSDLINDLLFQIGVELQTRLNHLVENIESLSNLVGRKLNRKQTETVNAIQEDANILINIANSTVNFKKSEKNRKLEKTDLNKIVRDVVTHYQTIAQVDRIIIQLELPPQPTFVAVYASQIIKVIEGLLSNALKHSPPKAQITIRLEKKDSCAIMTVTDQGEGINDKLVESIFEERTSRDRGHVKRFGGIGISLPMMKEIISAHRGKISIDSGNGKGFIVYISLPL